MGVPVVKKAEKAIEQSLPNGNDVKVSEADHHASSTIEEKDREKEKEKENNGGCCQGANGFSCCRDETPETETEKEVNKVLGAFNTLRKKWEKHDVVTVAAVVGAVVTVAVAYSFYRRLR
ncbi:putative thioredoxin-like ferredoxin [Helianthus annuus]|nr:putative thioredoxin-like ferredoxin [Helianthus annuus]